MKRLMMVIAVLMTSVAAAGQAPRLPEGFSTTQFGGSLSAPTAMAFAPDGRLFVLEQDGDVRVILANGTQLPDPFTSFDVDDDGERGLLGIAFDPNFDSNNFIYFYYTKPGASQSRNRVDRVTANGNAAVLGSAVNIITLPLLSNSATNHNGGAIHFGKDGKLYVAVGENAHGPNSQTLNTRLGKILRYNKDGSIPSDNPFFNQTTGENRSIWAMGLRNPYTFDFQPGTGLMHINDVGSGSWEEINVGAAGANYGWPTVEGDANNPSFVDPLYAYSHSASNCAITGGSFYNPNTALYTGYTGDYFFADFCQDELRVLEAGTSNVTVFDNNPPADGIVDMHVGPDGKLYTLARSPGSVHRYEFEVQPASGELIINGSFETDANNNKIADKWIPNGASATRVCGNGKATDGVCALRMKNGGKIKQKISGAGLVVGTALDLSAMVSGINVKPGTTLKLTIVTTVGTDSYFLPVPTGTYSAQAVTHPTITLTAQGVKALVQVIYPSGNGKAFVDEVSLMATPPVR